MRNRAVLSVMLLTVASAPGPAPAAAQDTFDRGRFAQQVDSLAHAFLQERPAAGVAIGVEKDGEVILAKGYGLAEIEHNVPVTVETVFRLGSISKQFTSVAILQLMEQGKVSLDDPITKFIPDYPTQGHEVTVHHLLTHTSGIVSYTGMGPRFWDQSRLDLSHDEMLDLFGNEPFEFAPGEQWKYNNSGYYLLGMIVEIASGTPVISFDDGDGTDPVPGRRAGALRRDEPGLGSRRAPGSSRRPPALRRLPGRVHLRTPRDDG